MTIATGRPLITRHARHVMGEVSGYEAVEQLVAPLFAHIRTSQTCSNKHIES
jgi:hypothetical protein